MERGIPIRAIGRSIAVLQAINRHQSLSLTEIAREIDLPYPTTLRIVKTLIYEGLVEAEPSRKRYRSTVLVHSLSSGFLEYGNLVAVSRPHIVALTEQISWPVGISTHVGRWMIVRDSTHTLTSLTFTNYVPGHTFPILECSSGHVYLAYVAPANFKSIIDGIKTLEGESAALTIFESGKILERIRADGFAAIERNRNTPDVGKTSSFSAPIFGHGHIVGTLTVTFFASVMSMEDFVKRFAKLIKDLTATISTELSNSRDYG